MYLRRDTMHVRSPVAMPAVGPVAVGSSDLVGRSSLWQQVCALRLLHLGMGMNHCHSRLIIIAILDIFLGLSRTRDQGYIRYSSAECRGTSPSPPCCYLMYSTSRTTLISETSSKYC